MPLRSAIYEARKTKHTVKRKADSVAITVIPLKSDALEEVRMGHDENIDISKTVRRSLEFLGEFSLILADHYRNVLIFLSEQRIIENPSNGI